MLKIDSAKASSAIFPDRFAKSQCSSSACWVKFQDEGVGAKPLISTDLSDTAGISNPLPKRWLHLEKGSMSIQKTSLQSLARFSHAVLLNGTRSSARWLLQGSPELDTKLPNPFDAWI